MTGLDWQGAVKVLSDNLVLVLVAVAIPLLILGVFTAIRTVAGNTVTAMPDALVYLFSVNITFLLSPDLWKKMVHPSVRDSFPALSLILALLALIVFCRVLPVERKIVAYHFRQTWASSYPASTIPPAIRNQKFPYGGFIMSWIAISTFAAVNALAFVLR